MGFHHPHVIATNQSSVQIGWKAFPNHLAAIFLLGVILIQLLVYTPTRSESQAEGTEMLPAA